MKPKYLDEVVARLQDREPGVYEATVFHDAWFDLLNGKGPCNCEPEVGPGVKMVQHKRRWMMSRRRARVQSISGKPANDETLRRGRVPKNH